MSEDRVPYGGKLTLVVADTEAAAVRLAAQQREDILGRLEELMQLARRYKYAQLVVAMAFSDEAPAFLPNGNGVGKVRVVSGSSTMNRWDHVLIARLLADQVEMARRGAP
jgi:hypothetical protein